MRKERRLQCSQSQLVAPQRTIKRMLPQPRNDLSFTYDQPGLCGAEQLIATKRNHIDSTLYNFAHNRFIYDAIFTQISELARTGVFIERKSRFAREGRQLGTRGRTHETQDAVVRRVHAHDEPCIRVDGTLV